MERIGTPDAMLLLLLLLLLFLVPSPGGGGSSGFSDMCVSKSASLVLFVSREMENLFFSNFRPKREGEYISRHKENAHEETNEDADDAPISLLVPSLSFCARARAFFVPT